MILQNKIILDAAEFHYLVGLQGHADSPTTTLDRYPRCSTVTNNTSPCQ